MENDKNVVEKDITIKEEMNDLGERGELELKNEKDNMNQSSICKSKFEPFFSYLFSFFFSLSTSYFSSYYREEKRREEKTILNKGDRSQIKIYRNKNGSCEVKKLLRNDLNYKVTKANIKRKIIKNNKSIIIYIIIINSFNLLLPNINNFLFESKFSNITLKIKGTGEKYILGLFPNEFGENYYPSMIYINGKRNFTITNKYYFDREENYVNLIWDNNIDNCYGMFHLCTDITEIDLSNFDTSEVTFMPYMFDNCYQLSSINFSNIKTSKVTNMCSMFNSCFQLTSLNLSSFDTSKVTHMGFMFYYCTHLFSLNLSNFVTSKVTYMAHMFDSCSQLIYLNLKNFIENVSLDVTNIFIAASENIVVCLNENGNKIINEIDNKKCIKIDCSDNYLPIKIVNETNVCWDYNDNNILYQYEYNGIYYEDCNEGKLINNTQIKNCRCNNTMCKSCPNLPLNDTFCSECNTGYYPIENDIYSYGDKYFKCYKNSIGYYLDNSESIYKKCFYSCKSCEIKGDNNEHNCLECDDNYLYPTKVNNYSNCYKNCSYYHYNDNNKTFCTVNYSCPNKYPILIPDKNECIIDDNIYTSNEITNEIESSIIFNNNNPKSTAIIKSSIIFNNNNPKSTAIIDSSVIFNNNPKSTTIIEREDIMEYLEIMSIIKNLTNILNNDTIKKTTNEEIFYYDQLIYYLEILFTLKDFNTTKIDEGEDQAFETKKMKVTFTTLKNQKNNLNDNLTNIDLRECEEELIKLYNLKENEILYMKKMDIIQEGMRIPKIEYDVYGKLFGENLIKLNISICDNDIYLYLPVKNIGNLNQLNKSSDYYNDICSTAKSESGTDITHKDRQKEYINKTVCQDYCDFNGYNYTIQKSICECKAKESSSSSFFYMNIKLF